MRERRIDVATVLVHPDRCGGLARAAHKRGHDGDDEAVSDAAAVPDGQQHWRRAFPCSWRERRVEAA